MIMALKGPNFGEANAWQIYCTQILLDTLSLPDHQRPMAWAEARSKLLKLARNHIKNGEHQRIIIADADFANKQLNGLDLSYCYITRSDFKAANLRDTNFRYAIIRNGSLCDANAEGADFSRVDLEGALVENFQYNNGTKLNFSRFKPSGTFSSRLEDRVQKDQLAASNHNAPFLIRVLNVLTGYGFGIGRLLFSSLFLVILFAFLYRYFDPKGFAVGAGATKPDELTLWNFVLYSAERFMNASPWIYGVSNLSHFISVFETLVGLVALGFLVAMLIRQILRAR